MDSINYLVILSLKRVIKKCFETNILYPEVWIPVYVQRDNKSMQQVLFHVDIKLYQFLYKKTPYAV